MTQSLTVPTRELCNRITNYLSTGGLFNPELMDHDKVSDLLKDCRAALEAAAAQPSREAALVRAALELCEAIAQSEDHGDGAFDAGCAICLAHEDTRLALRHYDTPATPDAEPDFPRMTEEDLLRGLEGIVNTPPPKSKSGHCKTCGVRWREYVECEAQDCEWTDEPKASDSATSDAGRVKSDYCAKCGALFADPFGDDGCTPERCGHAIGEDSSIGMRERDIV